MKESGGDIAQIADLVSGTPDDFSVLAGSASTFYAALCVGVAGGILALSAMVPEACVRLFELAKAGDHHGARALQHRLVPLARLVGGHLRRPGPQGGARHRRLRRRHPGPPLAPVPAPGLAALGKRCSPPCSAALRRAYEGRTAARVVRAIAAAVGFSLLAYLVPI